MQAVNFSASSGGDKMNRYFAIAATLILGLALGGLAHANITGSSHDFTDNLKGKSGNSGAGTAFTESWNARNEICRVCHVPHDHGRATQRYLNGLLWNHGVSTATYTMYDNAWSSTLTGSQSAQPDGPSKLCLGCHDGTVAIDTFDNYAGGAIYFDNTSYNSGYKVPGFLDGGGPNLDLRGTHPLAIAFPAAEIGTQFNDPASATWLGGETVASTLNSNKIHCSTCHDVHSGTGSVATGSHLLRAAQTVTQGGVASGLCLTCHIK
jgi:hypothetical protein